MRQCMERHDFDSPMPSRSARRPLAVEEYVQGVLSGDRPLLARTITLVESNAPAHQAVAREVLQQLLPHAGQSIRIGITGVPGVGKSTLIEALGCFLCEQGYRVAVLAIDPSSSVSRGSILGDKTRMERLGRETNAFIRPSPSGGTLGGVTRKTRETMVVCEAGGFDVMLIETVGVGQSEAAVRGMVDFVLLLLLAGAGDELQGIKKGVIELADALLIHKADGDNLTRAEAAREEYARALRYLMAATEGWDPPVLTASSVTGTGIADLWTVVETFHRDTRASGVFAARRREQQLDWLHAMLTEALHDRFYQHPHVQQRLPDIEAAVAASEMPVSAAAQALLQVFDT
jgi:LAO/AO transport system kinase